MTNLNGRLTKLETRIKPRRRGPGYMSFATVEEMDRAAAEGRIPPHTKVYIGFSPDDWPEAEHEQDT